jgi:hypothetical protein
MVLPLNTPRNLCKRSHSKGAVCPRNLLFLGTVCAAGRDSGNGSSMAGNAVRIHRSRVRTGSSSICFARWRSAAKNHRRRRARPAGASEEATEPAYANPHFLAQARYRRDYSHRHRSDRSTVANGALIAAQARRCERVRGFFPRMISGKWRA